MQAHLSLLVFLTQTPNLFSNFVNNAPISQISAWPFIISRFQCQRSVHIPALPIDRPTRPLIDPSPASAASSPRPRPLKRLAHPDAVNLKILPRKAPLDRRLAVRDTALVAVDTDPRLKHSDSIRISINAFADTFHLHLTPNDDLLHPDAHIKYFKTAPDGSGSVLDRIEPIHRESVHIFGGKVIHDQFTQDALLEDDAGGIWRPNGVRAPGERGWARITVHDGGDPTIGRPPVFEGAFSVDGVIHHVTTKVNYLATKLALDPDPHPLDETDLVIFRDSDIASIEEEDFMSTGKPLTETRKTRPPTSCSHDRLAHNVAKSHPVLRAGLDQSPQETWVDPFGLNEHNRGKNMSLLPRQGDINNAGGNMSSNFANSIGSTVGCPIAPQIVRHVSSLGGIPVLTGCIGVYGRCR